MNLRSVMRYTYSLGWFFGAVAILYRLLERIFPGMFHNLPASSRGVLFFSGLLFLSTIATGIYAQVLTAEQKPAAGAPVTKAAA